MAITLSQLKKNLKTLTVEIDGDILTISYRPAAITPALWDELRSKEYDRNIHVDVLSRALAGWDLLDDDGQPLPILESELMELPGDFLAAIYNQIMSDTYSPKARSGSSGAGS